MASGAFRPVFGLLLVAETAPIVHSFLAAGDEPFDLRVPPQVRVVDDPREVALKPYPPFLDELRVGVGLLPEVSDREGGQFKLNQFQSTSS